MSDRRHEPVFPGFAEMAGRRRALAARLESGDADIRLSTLDRYAAALGHQLEWKLKKEGP